MAGKQKSSGKKNKKKKGKKGDGSAIAAAIMPTAMLAAVPRTPPPPKDPPAEMREGFNSNLLNSSLLGRMFATPDLEEERHVTDTDTSLYDYDQAYSMATDPLYSSVDFDDEGGPRGRRGWIRENEQRISADVIAPAVPQMGEETALKSAVVEGMYAQPIRKRDRDMRHTVDVLAVEEDIIVPKDARSENFEPRLNTLKMQTAELSARQRSLERSLEEQMIEQKLSMQSVQESIRSAPSDIQSAVAQQKAVTEDTLKRQEELIRTLQAANNTLGEENKELQDINHQLHSEITRLKKQRLRGSEDDGFDSSVATDAVAFKEENRTLKSAVHRLNIELSQWQAKHRPLEEEAKKSDSVGGLPGKGPIPSWLINTRYLAPLFLAYDDRLHEKNMIIKQYEDELMKFSDRVEEVIKDNERLHLRLEQTDISGPISMTEWKQLQEQAKLVLEENQLLMEQLDLQHNKVRDMHKAHVHEVSKLSKKLVVVEAEKEELDNSLTDMRKVYNNLKQKHGTLVIDTNSRVTKEVHVTALSDMKQSIEEEREKHSKEMDNVLAKLQTIQAEKKTLGLHVADLTTENKTIEAEIRGLQKAQKKAQRKILLLQKGLDFAENKEHTASHYLNSVIKMAEKTAMERDTYAKVVDSKEREKQQVINKVLEGNVVVGKMEEKLRLYKIKATEKVNKTVERMKELDSDFDKKRNEYEGELKHLRLLLKEKDALLGLSAAEKSQMEENLEIVWQAANADNKRMQETLRDSMRRLRTHKNLQPMIDDELDQEDDPLVISCTEEHTS